MIISDQHPTFRSLRRAPACWLRVTGEDAEDFLQSQFSNDVRSAAKAPVYGLWLDHRGKIHGDGMLIRESEEAWWIFSEETPLEALKEKLERHIIADDVELAAADSEVDGIVVFGLDEESKKSVEAFLKDGAGTPKPIYFEDRGGRLQVVGEKDAIEAAAQVLHREGVASASAEEYAFWRIEEGLPRIPQEVGPQDFPGDAGLAEYCCATKGCYLGQEVVARQARLDRGTRILKSVSLNGGPPTLPASLETAEGPIGELRAAAEEDGKWIGMAMVKTRALQHTSEFLVSDSDGLKGRFDGV